MYNDYLPPLLEKPITMFDREADSIRFRAGQLTANELAFDVRRRAGALTMTEEAQQIMANVNRIMPLSF